MESDLELLVRVVELDGVVVLLPQEGVGVADRVVAVVEVEQNGLVRWELDLDLHLFLRV